MNFLVNTILVLVSNSSNFVNYKTFTLINDFDKYLLV